MRLTSLISLLVATSLAPTVQAADLLDVYRLALKNDMTIRIAQANYMAAQEAEPQAWARYLPQIQGTFNVSESSADSEQAEFVQGQGFIVLQFDGVESNSESLLLTLNQTIFNWGTVQQIDAAGYFVAQAKADYQAAQQQLIVRVAEAYFNFLSAKDTLNAARANLAALEQQLEQTQKRYEVGLIAITDVQESQAAYDLAAAEEIQAELEVVTRREALSVIIGQYVENLAAPDDIPLVKPKPSDPDAWVELAMEQNLNLIAARFALKNAYANVDIAQADHYPTIGLSASYSDNTRGNDVVVSGVPYPDTTNSSTTIGLQLTVPIFSGGATSSQVDEAAALAMAQQAQLKLTTRETKQLARSAYLGVVSNLSRVKALKQAVKSAQTALEATEAGYEVGTRTTVDVLTSRQNLFTARTNYARAKYDYIINLLKLKAAAGTLTVESINTINTWLHK